MSVFLGRVELGHESMIVVVVVYVVATCNGDRSTILQWKKKMKEEGIFVLSCLTRTTKGILVISRAYESITSATSLD